MEETSPNMRCFAKILPFWLAMDIFHGSGPVEWSLPGSLDPSIYLLSAAGHILNPQPLKSTHSFNINTTTRQRSTFVLSAQFIPCSKAKGTVSLYDQNGKLNFVFLNSYCRPPRWGSPAPRPCSNRSLLDVDAGIFDRMPISRSRDQQRRVHDNNLCIRSRRTQYPRIDRQCWSARHNRS